MPHKQRVLIVDDDVNFCVFTAKLLEKKGIYSEYVHNDKNAYDSLEKYSYDLVLLDFHLGQANGIEVLKILLNTYPGILVVMITSHTDFSTAVEAIKIGAYDYIPKTLEPEETILKIKHALDKNLDLAKIKYLENNLNECYSFANIIGKNKKMQEIYGLIETVCFTDVTVLIRGETGTGKELAAKAIHFNSHRKNHPFMSINCASMQDNLIESELFGHEKGAFTDAYSQKDGKVEIAEGGTLFLDEMGDLPISIQSKLLRFLQDKTFERVGGTEKMRANVRIISATNRDLLQMTKTGEFREDLYYRLNVMELIIPPLRERIDDIPVLVEHFLKLFNRKYKKDISSLSEEAMNALLLHGWPGNVRELEHLIEKSVLLSKGGVIGIDDVSIVLNTNRPSDSLPICTAVSLSDLKTDLEKKYLIKLLADTNWHVTDAIQRSKIDRKAFYLKLQQYNIQRPDNT